MVVADDTAKAPLAIHFADRGDLFDILLKNALLTLVTLGIYRFWARTTARRYWWGSVVVDGDPLEYTGTGGELFIGFMAFLAILLPIGIVYGLVSVYLRSTVWGPLFVGLLQLSVFFILVPIALFRARRYRLSRTLWRGVRGGMAGSTWRYLGITLLGVLASAFSLGVAMPWMRMAQTRYATDCSSFGDQRMRFDGSAKPLILPWVGILVLPLACVIASAIMIGHYGAAITALGQHAPRAETAALGLAVIPWTVLFGFSVLAAVLGYVWYRLYEFRYVARHTMLGPMRFGSDLKPVGTAATIFGVACLLMIASGFVLTAVGAAIFVVETVLGEFQNASSGHWAGTIGFVVIALIASMGGGIARILFIDKLIVRRLVDSLSIDRPDLLVAIRQSTLPVPGSGEGMADSFDIGVF